MPGFLQIISRFLGQAAPSISLWGSRWEFANIAAAVALLSIAFAAIAFFLFRRKTRDPTLIYFGIFCALYAFRLLANARFFRSLFNQPGSFWDYVNWDITCTILVPFGLFFYQVGSEFLRKFFRWLLAAQMLFAVFGISAAALGASLPGLASSTTSSCSPRALSLCCYYSPNGGVQDRANS